MRRFLTVVLLSSLLPLSLLRAEADPSAVFLNAFMSVRDAEKLEREENFQAALAKYRYAGSLLDQLHTRHPEWQTMIVEYRQKKTAEAIAALQEKLALEPPVDPEALASATPAHPPGSLDAGLPSQAGSLPATSTTDIFEQATRQIRDRMAQLEGQLDATRRRLEATESERQRMARELNDALRQPVRPVDSAQLEAFQETEKQLKAEIAHLKALVAGAGANAAGAGESKLWADLEEARAEAARARTQLEQARSGEAALVARLTAAQSELEKAKEGRNSASAEIRRQIAQLQEALIDARADREVAEEQGEIMARKMAVLARRPDLGAELEQARQKADAIAAENEKLNKAAEEADRKLAALMKELDGEKGEKTALTTRLTTAETRVKELEEAERKLVEMTQERNQAVTQAGELNTRLEDKGREVAALTTERDTLARERDTLLKERDEAVKKAGEIDTESGKLLTRNQELLKKLETTEATLSALNASQPEQEKEITRLKKELEETNTAIGELRKTAETDKNTIADLNIQLDNLNAAVEGKAPSPEQARLTQENELLRGIVLRKLKDQVQREKARTAIAEELARLQVRSKAINDQVAVLSRPTLELNDQERALFRTPQLEILDNEKDSMIFSIVAPQTDRPASEGEKEPPAQKKRLSDGVLPAANPFSGPQASLWNRGPKVETGRKPNIPENLQPLAQEAREKFDQGEYNDAERLYEELAKEAPSNIYILSNLGMTRYRGGKLRLAEETFKKVLSIEPGDAYSQTTLGIVYHAQSRYDEAIDALTRSIAANPKNPMAHNFLGITAAKKGWVEAARKEIETAIEIDPNYADAHFNLAVVFATTKPADKENARKHYRKAVELGVKPDPNLENLIR